jgi:hypothetical protein
MGKLFVTPVPTSRKAGSSGVFAPLKRDFVAEFIPQSGAPQLLLLHLRQICNGCCTRTRASVRNLNPAP